MEYVIVKGAGRFLRAIVNTPGVFRFDKAGSGDAVECRRYVTYDVTNLTPFTRLSQAENDVFQR